MTGEVEVIQTRIRETNATARPEVGTPSSFYGTVGDFSESIEVNGLIAANISRTLESESTVGLIFSGQMDHSGGAGPIHSAEAFFVIDGQTYYGSPNGAQKYVGGADSNFNISMVAAITLPAGAHTFNVLLQTNRVDWEYHYLSLIVMVGGATAGTSLIVV